MWGVREGPWRKRYEKASAVLDREFALLLMQESSYLQATRRMNRMARQVKAAAKTKIERKLLQYKADHHLFMVATQKEAPFRSVTTRFQKVCRFGCDLLYAEVFTHVTYGWYCERHGKPKVGIKTLEKMRCKVLNSGQNPRSAHIRQLLEWIDGCLIVLRERDRTDNTTA